MVNVMKASFAPKRLYLAGLALLVLALAVFVQAAFNLESFLSPSFPNQIVLFFTLSTIVFLVLTVSAFILARSLFKLLMERRSEKPGARFKTRLVMSMILLTLFPAIALFAFAFGLVNRSIDKWFSVPVDRVFETAADIQTEWTTEHESAARGALMEIAAELPVDLDRTASNLRLDAVAVLDETGRVVRGSSNATAYAEVFREQLIQANGETRAAAPPILVAQPDGSLVGLVPVTGIRSPIVRCGGISQTRPPRGSDADNFGRVQQLRTTDRGSLVLSGYLRSNPGADDDSGAVRGGLDRAVSVETNHGSDRGSIGRPRVRYRRAT